MIPFFITLDEAKDRLREWCKKIRADPRPARRQLTSTSCAALLFAQGAYALDMSDVNRAIDIIGKIDAMKNDRGSSPTPAPAPSQSGGADSPRPLTLRQKPSTGEWFVWGRPSFLGGIRKPATMDKWR